MIGECFGSFSPLAMRSHGSLCLRSIVRCSHRVPLGVSLPPRSPGVAADRLGPKRLGRVGRVGEVAQSEGRPKLGPLGARNQRFTEGRWAMMGDDGGCVWDGFSGVLGCLKGDDVYVASGDAEVEWRTWRGGVHCG